MMAPLAVKPAQPPASFEAFYAAHASFVWRALTRLGVPRPNLDDAVQEVFLMAYRHLPGFEGRSSLRTWLAAITVRVAGTCRRNVQRRGGEQPVDETLPDGRGAPDELVARAEAVAELRRMLATLPDEQQEVFVLMELEGYTAPEVAEATEVSVNTVYSRLRLARAAFNDAIERAQEGRR